MSKASSAGGHWACLIAYTFLSCVASLIEHVQLASLSRENAVHVYTPYACLTELSSNL